jgi:DNA polymerase-3 subunit epsilon
MYSIIDIETTGGSPQYEKITEIAIYIHDGEKITNEFVTLINPEKDIPYYITGLTGISNEMVTNSPKFYEVAKKIIELTENKIFVAHNANFDYNFVRSEFRSLGFNFKRELLCTVKLSRKLIPGKKSYSLGNLCNDLEIQINDRHRASGDAKATVKLFELLLGINKQKGINGINHDDLGVLHPNLDKNKILKLPEEAGVYYLYNDRQDIIYIGKSNNIKSRVSVHLGPSKNSTAQKMRKEIADVSYEITGSELVALLLESEEIKKNKPFYNRSQRRTIYNHGIFSFYNDNNYLCFKIEDVNSQPVPPLKAFDSLEKARIGLTALVEEYMLCQKLCGLYNSQGPCFHFEIRKCNGACTGAEPAPVYNQRAILAKNKFGNIGESLIIVDKGRYKEEKSIVRIVNGKYIGYGFIESAAINGLEALHDCIKPKKDNQDVVNIIKGQLKKSKVERIIRG